MYINRLYDLWCMHIGYTGDIQPDRRHYKGDGCIYIGYTSDIQREQCTDNDFLGVCTLDIQVTYSWLSYKKPKYVWCIQHNNNKKQKHGKFWIKSRNRR